MTRFPIVNCPWLSSSFPSYGYYISQLIRSPRCSTCVLDFHTRNLRKTFKFLTQGYRYQKLRKTSWKYPDPTLNFYRNLVLYRFKDMYQKESSLKSFMMILFTNYLGSGAQIISLHREQKIKRRRCRQYDPGSIEKTIGLVLGPSTATKAFALSIALWLIIRRALHNLKRGDRVPSFVPSDC